MIELKKKKSLERERCILIGIINRDQDEEKSREYLEELRFLADTAGADTVHMFTQKLSQSNSRTFLGSGKMEDIKGYVKAENIDMIIFDDELTPSQLKNIEALSLGSDCIYHLGNYVINDNLISAAMSILAWAALTKLACSMARIERMLE